MSAISRPKVPDTVAHLDPDVVVEVLSRYAINVSDAAGELGVASADLRRLLWANPKLTDAAVEIEERRLDLAERNIYEALRSNDSRRRDGASFFVIRNSHRARKRGWITTSTSASELSVTANAPARTLTFRWRTSEDDERDARQPRPSGYAMRGNRWSALDGPTAAKPSNTRPTGAFEQGLKSWRRLRKLVHGHPAVDWDCGRRPLHRLGNACAVVMRSTKNHVERSVLMTETSAFLGAQPRAGPPRTASTGRGRVSTIFQSCQSLAMVATSGRVRP
jgi:hypothetical protein